MRLESIYLPLQVCTNPIDLTAGASVTNPEFYLAPLKALVNDPDVDNIIFTDFPFTMG